MKRLLACIAPRWLARPPRGRRRLDGAAVFAKACASCHADGQTSAPTPAALRALPAESILNALTNGRMQVQGSALSATERSAVALFAAGRARATPSPPLPQPRTVHGVRADGQRQPRRRAGTAGATAPPTRASRANGGLTAADLPRLKLKWAFGYSGVSAARAQPTIAGGRLFVASENGEVHALDPKTGCTHWTFKAAGRRAHRARRSGPTRRRRRRDRRCTSATRAPPPTPSMRRPARCSGPARWTITRRRRSTGAPTVHGGRVFVPVQGLNEEGQGGTRRLPVLHVPRQPGGARCEHRRRGVEDLHRGRGRSRAPRTRRASRCGAPAGGGIWSAPTVDAKRGAVYVATGNGYADPPQPMTDAVVAMDLQTGARAVGAADDRRTTAGRWAASRRTPTTRPARPRSGPITTSPRRRPSPP